MHISYAEAYACLSLQMQDVDVACFRLRNNLTLNNFIVSLNVLCSGSLVVLDAPFSGLWENATCFAEIS